MIDVLPDDMVVAVLALLDVGDVLRARVTCRRMHALGVHPDVWRHRRLTHWRPASTSLRKAVLRVAPCLRLLDLCGDKSFLSEDDRQLLWTTTCAAEELVADIYFRDCVPAVRNQLMLGRVKSVRLNLRLDGREWTPDVYALVRDILTAPHLRELSVDCFAVPPADMEDVAPSELAPASLRKLGFYHARPDLLPASWLHFLLRSHAPTLEEVRFMWRVPSAADTLALASAPNLRVLRCPGWPGLADLANAKALTSLTLEDGVGPSVAAFLRSAIHVERLDLQDADAARVQGAVEAAASSGRSSLRDLTVGPYRADFYRFTKHRRANLSTLGLALPSLRHLSTLCICWAPQSGFFAALSAQTVPHLVSLRVNLWFHQCAHAWLHDGLLDLLEGLPDLRVVAGMAGHCGVPLPYLVPFHYGHRPDQGQCAPCQRGCHVAADWVQSSRDSRMSHQTFCCAMTVDGPRVSWLEASEQNPAEFVLQ